MPKHEFSLILQKEADGSYKLLQVGPEKKQSVARAKKAVVMAPQSQQISDDSYRIQRLESIKKSEQVSNDVTDSKMEMPE